MLGPFLLGRMGVVTSGAFKSSVEEKDTQEATESSLREDATLVGAGLLRSGNGDATGLAASSCLYGFGMLFARPLGIEAASSGLTSGDTFDGEVLDTVTTGLSSLNSLNRVGGSGRGNSTCGSTGGNTDAGV